MFAYGNLTLIGSGAFAAGRTGNGETTLKFGADASSSQKHVDQERK